jgi:NAD(P)-dependent dehydrogenase (short-subunit alcohol dehydrogenase family)
VLSKVPDLKSAFENHDKKIMASYLITGAGRGLGLEMVRVLSQKPSSEVSAVFATIRSVPPPALQEIISQSQDRVIVVQLEVSDPASIATAASEVKEKLDGRGLDVLINNAAVSSLTPTSMAATTTLQSTFQINADAVNNITVAFLPLLREGIKKLVVNM